MFYPVYVHAGDSDHAHAVTFPDFPGCFAAADELDALPAAIQEAVQAHYYGEPHAVPPPSPLAALANDAAYQGGVWMLVDVDLAAIDSRPMRLNISLPAHVVKQIDTWASAHHMTRSGFLAQAALQAMRAG